MEVKEYTERNRKTIESPSGMKFTIRKIPTRTYSKIEQLSSKVKKDISDGEASEKFYQMTLILLPACVMSPKISIDEYSDKKVHIDDIDVEDASFIVSKIYDFTGLSSEKMEEIEEFRE